MLDKKQLYKGRTIPDKCRCYNKGGFNDKLLYILKSTIKNYRIRKID